jgi:hypothetical protein
VPWNTCHLGDAEDHAAVDRLAGRWPQDERSINALAAAGFEDPEHGDGDGHGGGLAALADQVQDAVTAQGLGVVLDPYRGDFRGAERVDAEQERQGSVVHREGLGDLEEPDELEPVESLGPCLVGVDLRQPRVDGRVGGDQAVDVREPEKSPDAACSMVLEESRSPASCKCRM